MMTALLVLLLLLAAAVLLLLLRLRRGQDGESPMLLLRLDGLDRGQERTERGLRADLAGQRDDLARQRDEGLRQARGDREELAVVLREFSAAVGARLQELGQAQQSQLDAFGRVLATMAQTSERNLQALHQANGQRLDAFALQIGRLSESHEVRAEALRTTVDQRLQQLATDNGLRLEQMRATVDEKLQGTLEKRLGESFRQVSERLEQVHKGLGEMQVLAGGVGDLKRVLTNVKTRGGWGEVQLEALMSEILAPEQFERNVATRPGSQERVEFAIRLPGRQGGESSQHADEPVWLPIDAKFPLEDWQRLLEAEARADTAAAQEAGKALETRVKTCAKDIQLKYLHPPHTTDFGLMFLPVEGLYAEVARRPALLEVLQREHRVIVAGPTTLAALLNSLQMGFRTLAIQRRSSEVWQLLGAVKSEFGKFGGVLDGVKKKLDQASGQIDDAARRSRAIERKLRAVQELPSGEASALLGEAAEAPEVVEV